MQQPNAKPNHLPEGFYYQQKALSAQKSLDLFYFLQQHLNWQQPNITVFGKTHPIPRLQCFIADEQINYAYSGTQLVVEPWPEVLDAMRKRLSQQLRIPFNALLVNLYRDGQDCMGWHSDDEKELVSSRLLRLFHWGLSGYLKLSTNTVMKNRVSCCKVVAA